MDDCLKQHMCATVQLRESKLQRVESARNIYRGLINIAKLGGHEKLPDLLQRQSDSHVKALEELAEEQYQSRLLYYVLCAMESDHSLTPDDAIAQAESMVLEAVIGT